jgi:HAD superfamily hydrolase (TIGR01509 family)
MEVTILIPMAGMGSRFRDVGFLQPKPVIDIGGKPMIMWVVENILPRCFDLKAKIVVVIRRDQDQLARVAVQLRQIVPNLEVVYADALTQGAACTCLLAREHICNERPLLIINSDQYIDWNDAGDSSAFWQQMAREAAQGYDANILCFKRPMELGDTKWSYAATDTDGFVNAVREKEVISDNATVGAYYWQRGADFVSSAEEMIARDVRVHGEFYVAPAYNIALERGQRVRLSFCRRLWGLGVPADLTDFISCHLRQRSMDHTASILGCSLQDLGHLSPLLPGALVRAVGDDRMGHDCREPHAAPTGPHAPSLCAPFHSPLHSAHVSSDASEDEEGGGGEESLVLLEALRNMQRVKFITCENEPRLIEAAISDGFDVKVCVQYVEAADDAPFQDSAAPQGEALATDRCRQAGRYLLGGDGALHEVSLGLLQRLGASLWIECQDTATLCHFASMMQLQSFARTNQEVVLTSQKKLWAPFPHAFKPAYGQDTVAVLPPGAGAADAVPLLWQAVAICCQDVRGLREKRDVILRAAQVALCSPVFSTDMTGCSYRRIKLIVFDLDGVLVESKHLHFEAMNQALSAVAGQDMCISPQEHEMVYDGLSTQQKLHLLTRSRGLPLKLHDAVWQKKQQLTRELVKHTVAPDRDIETALTDIKRAGFPVAVASNCTRESVLALLSAVGIAHLVDAIYCNEDVANPKPDPDIYQLVARSFGNLPPHQVAVFEDSKRGFEAAVRAQCNLFKVKDPRDIRAKLVLGRVLEFEACSIMEPLVNVVVPMSGAHPIFCMEGPDRQDVEVPVGLSSVRGKPALFWTIQSLQPLPKRVHFIFVVRRSLGKSSLCSLSRILPWSVDYSSMSIVVLDKPTRGAAQSVLEARHLIDNHQPLAIFDGSHRLVWPRTSNGLDSVIASMLSEPPDTALQRAHQGQCAGGSAAQDGVLCAPRALVTVHRARDPRWSYVQFTPGSLSHVVSVKENMQVSEEKMQVSDVACSGDLSLLLRKVTKVYPPALRLHTPAPRSLL